MSKIIGEWTPPPAVKPPRTDRLTAMLSPGERLLWTGRGHGNPGGRPRAGMADILDVFFYIGVFALLALAAFASLVGIASFEVGVIIALFGFGLLTVRSVSGHSVKTYGLTAQRIIVIDRMMPGFSASYWLRDLRTIQATGTRQRGDVKLGPGTLIGLPRPLDIANRIAAQKIGVIVQNLTR